MKQFSRMPKSQDLKFKQSKSWLFVDYENAGCFERSKKNSLFIACFAVF